MIAEKIAELVGYAKQLYGKDFSDVRWSMNNRLTSTAGRAFLTERRMDFSTSLFEQNREKFVEDTVGHEFAHIVAYEIYGDKGHGIGWKAVMQDMGIESQRCHTYATQKRTSKKYIYSCGCQNHEVSPQRRSWINRGKIYKCVKCGNIINFVGEA